MMTRVPEQHPVKPIHLNSFRTVIANSTLPLHLCTVAENSSSSDESSCCSIIDQEPVVRRTRRPDNLAQFLFLLPCQYIIYPLSRVFACAASPNHLDFSTLRKIACSRPLTARRRQSLHPSANAQHLHLVQSLGTLSASPTRPGSSIMPTESHVAASTYRCSFF